jgi:hypothetical protein
MDYKVDNNNLLLKAKLAGKTNSEVMYLKSKGII